MIFLVFNLKTIYDAKHPKTSSTVRFVNDQNFLNKISYNLPDVFFKTLNSESICHTSHETIHYATHTNDTIYKIHCKLILQVHYYRDFAGKNPGFEPTTFRLASSCQASSSFLLKQPSLYVPCICY